MKMLSMSFVVFFAVGFSILADGALDATFDTDGKLITAGDNNANSGAKAVAMQSDGKIVVAGYLAGAGIYQGFCVMRYNSDGSLDTGFDTDGKLRTQFVSSTYAEATCVAIQSDGKIVVAGWGNFSGTNHFLVARYNSSGSLDTGFDSDGKITGSTEFGIEDDRANAIAMQSDGKILVAGYSQNGSTYDLAVARYNTDGSLDTGFSGDGLFTTTLSGATELVAYSIAVQSDGKILLGGEAIQSGNKNFLVVRLNSNGTLDTNFDSDGIVTTAIGTGEDEGRAIAVQADGKIVLAGFTYTSTRYQFALARYTSTGALDTGFDTDGKVTTSISASDSDFVYTMALQLDGRIVVGGYSENGWGTGTFALARYNSTGSLDTGFDTDGKLTTSFGGTTEKCFGVALQSDGKIVAVGEYYNSGYWFGVSRYEGSSGPLPVQLSDFNVRVFGFNPSLTWRTATELNNYGFEIERSTSSSQLSAASWQKVGFVAGSGTSSSPREYSFVDRNLAPGRYAYRIKQIDNDGTFQYHGNAEVEIGLTEKQFVLESNYPNPFNPSTTIRFTLAEDAKTRLRVFNVLGEQVATLFDDVAQAGRLHEVTFDATRLPSGVYFSTLESGNLRVVKKMVLMK